MTKSEVIFYLVLVSSIWDHVTSAGPPVLGKPVIEETIVPDNFVPLGFPISTAKPDSLQNSKNADIVVMFHVGNKVKAKSFNKGLKQYLSKLFEKAQIDSGHARVGFINYGAKAKEIFGLTKFSKKSLVRNTIRKWKPKPFRNSKANLADGLKLARTKTFSNAGGSRLAEGVPSALIIITDMRSSSDRNVVQQEANQLKNMGVTLFTVGVDKADLNELKTITSPPLNDFHQSVRSFLDLAKDKGALSKVTNQIKALQKTTTRPPRPTRPPVKTTRAPTTSTTPTTTTRATTTPPTTRATTTPPTTRATTISRTTGYSPNNIIFVFQSSSSTSPKDYKKLLKFMSAICSNARIPRETKMVVVNFGKVTRVIMNSTDISDASNPILNINKRLRSKNADLGTALKIIREDVLKDRDHTGGTHIVVIADQKIDKGYPDFEQEARKLQRKGIIIHGISVSQGPKLDLKKVVTVFLSDAYIQTVDSYSSLEGIQNDLVSTLLSVPPSTTSMTTTKRSSSIKYDLTDKTYADVVVAFHASSAVKKKTFKKRLLKFIVNLVKKSSIDNGKVRIGLVSFGAKFQKVFDLGDYVKKKDIKKAIKKTPKSYKSDTVNLASALEQIRTDMFFSPKDRKDVQNYIVIISDTQNEGRIEDVVKERELMSDTVIHAISIGKEDKQLERIASDPRKKFYQVFGEFEDLAKFKKAGKQTLKNIPALKIKKKRKKKNKKGKKGKGKSKKTKLPTTTYSTANTSSIKSGKSLAPTTLTEQVLKVTSAWKLETKDSMPSTGGPVTSTSNSFIRTTEMDSSKRGKKQKKKKPKKGKKKPKKGKKDKNKKKGKPLTSPTTMLLTSPTTKQLISSLSSSITTPLTLSIPKLLSASTIKLLTSPRTKLLSASTTPPLTSSTTQPITLSTTKSLTASTRKPLSPSTTTPLTSFTTKPITSSTTKPLTMSTTKPLTTPATMPLTLSTTKPLTSPTTKPLPSTTAYTIYSKKSETKPERSTVSLYTASFRYPVAKVSMVTQQNTSTKMTTATAKSQYKSYLSTFPLKDVSKTTKVQLEQPKITSSASSPSSTTKTVTYHLTTQMSQFSKKRTPLRESSYISFEPTSGYVQLTTTPPTTARYPANRSLSKTSIKMRTFPKKSTTTPAGMSFATKQPSTQRKDINRSSTGTTEKSKTFPEKLYTTPVRITKLMSTTPSTMKSPTKYPILTETKKKATMKPEQTTKYLSVTSTKYVTPPTKKSQERTISPKPSITKHHELEPSILSTSNLDIFNEIPTVKKIYPDYNRFSTTYAPWEWGELKTASPGMFQWLIAWSTYNMYSCPLRFAAYVLFLKQYLECSANKFSISLRKIDGCEHKDYILYLNSIESLH